MKEVTDPGILAQLNGGGAKEVTDPAILAQLNPAAAKPTGEQPSTLDRVVASPPVRLLHDVGGGALRGVADLATMFGPLSAGKPGIDMIANAIERPYQAALARNRNTPGYAAARASADQSAAQFGRGGFRDQLTAPFNPGIAGIATLPGGLDQSNANADSQAAAQGAYAKRHPILSTASNVMGGLLLAPQQAALPAAMPKMAAPATADLKSAAKASYEAVDNSGVRVSNQTLNRLGDSIQDSFGHRLDPTLHPDATAAFNRVAQYATDGAKGDVSASFQDLDNLRRIVADAAKSTKPADKAMARMMMDRIDDFVDNLKAADLDTSLQDELRASLTAATSQKGQVAKQIKSIEANKPGALAARGAAGKETREQYMALQEQLPQAEQARLAAKDAFSAETDLINAGPQATIDALNHARDMWSRASQAELIEKQIEKASLRASGLSQSGYENALRVQFRNLAMNDGAMARLSPEVREAVKEVVKGGKLSNIMRAVGKYAPHGPVATAAGMTSGYMLGGVEGGGLGALALPALGEAARVGATAKTVNAANRARDTAALGRGVTIPASPSPLQLPRLPPLNSLPYGLLMQPSSVPRN